MAGQEGKNRSKHSIVADRVVFLSSQQADENFDFASQDKGASAPVKKAAPAKPRAAKEEKLPEVQFKDEPPFEDDLPF